MIKDVRNGGKFRGWTIHGIFVAAGFAVRNRPIEIARNEEIKPPVVVIVEKAGGDRPAARRHTRFCRNVCKCAVSIVVIENVFAEVGDVNIGIAIVVVVSNGDAHSIVAVVHIC